MGLGRKLVEAAVLTASRSGESAVSMVVDERNERALALYRKVGFRIAGALDELDEAAIEGEAQLVLRRALPFGSDRPGS
jgi:ribosomal protein S18 acetylase RimI-like enzyme